MGGRLLPNQKGAGTCAGLGDRRVDSGLVSPNLLRVPGLAVGRCRGMAVLVAVPHTRQALREAVSVRLGCPVCGQAAASSRAVHLSPSEAAPCTSLACRHHCDCTRSGAESRASCWKRWGLAHLCGLLLGKEFTAGLKGGNFDSRGEFE